MCRGFSLKSSIFPFGLACLMGSRALGQSRPVFDVHCGS